ncbi:hypothetical protein ABPG74_007020 [Tetrahymena malaccensis]
MAEQKQTEQKGKKVSLFKQKMQAQKEQIKENQPNVQAFVTENNNSNNLSNQNEQVSQVVAFPESIKLSQDEIQKNLIKIEQEEEEQKKQLQSIKNSTLFVNPQEYEQINSENEAMLKNMKQDEIEALQKQLYSILDPGVISRFKKRDLFKVNEHPSAINEYKQDAYGLEVDHFIKNNQEEIKKVYGIECRTPQDAVKQACFDKNGNFQLNQTLENKMKDLENIDFDQIESLNFDLLNQLIDHGNRNFNSLAIDAIERIITQMQNQIKNSNQGDFLFELQGIKVFRLDVIYYLESQLSLAFTLCRCLTVPNMTLNLNTITCLRIYLQFMLQDELNYYKQFLYKLSHSESQKKKFKAITQIFIDENLLRQISYIINNLILGDKSDTFFIMFIDILESLICIDHEYFTKKIVDFGFVEQIRAIGGQKLEEKLEFLKFEVSRLDYVYENIPLTLETFKLLREAKQQISNITLEKYNQSLQKLIGQWKLIKLDSNASIQQREIVLKKIRDLLIFGERLNLVKKISLEKNLFQLNSSIIENTILLILELHNEKGEQGYVLPEEKAEIKHFLFEQNEALIKQAENNQKQHKDFQNTYTKQDISLLIEGLIYSEGKGIPHCYKHIIDKIIPLDVQIMYKYHYQLKEKKSHRIANHFFSMKSFIKLFTALYTELSFQMKFVILKKQRKALSVRSSFNECFSDILRVIIIEFVEFFTLKGQEDQQSLNEQQIQLSLSFIQLLSEIKQTEAFISVLNIIKQVSVKNTQNDSLKTFDALSNFFVSIKAKTNQNRLPGRQKDLEMFLDKIDLFCSFFEPKQENLFYYHSELFYLRVCKIFDDENHTFSYLNVDALDKLFTTVCQYVDTKVLNILYNKNSDIPQKIITNFNYNSYGNPVFTRIVFFLLQKPFDLKMKKKIMIDTVLSYAFLFSENCKDKAYGKESNYLRRLSNPEDKQIKLKTECEEIEKFLTMNEIDTVSRSSFFNKFLHSYIQNSE